MQVLIFIILQVRQCFFCCNKDLCNDNLEIVEEKLEEIEEFEEGEDV